MQLWQFYMKEKDELEKLKLLSFFFYFNDYGKSIKKDYNTQKSHSCEKNCSLFLIYKKHPMNSFKTFKSKDGNSDVLLLEILIIQFMFNSLNPLFWNFVCKFVQLRNPKSRKATVQSSNTRGEKTWSKKWIN